MKAFSIDTDSNITVHTTAKAARETGGGVFATEEELAELTGPDTKRLLAIWNSLTGFAPVRKFQSNAVAVRRVFAAVSKLEPAEPQAPTVEAESPQVASEKAPAKTKPGKAKKSPKPAADAGMPRDGSKAAQVVKMLQRKHGASLEELNSAMGWQPHTTRALMSAGGSLRKKFGLAVVSELVGDKRTYRIG